MALFIFEVSALLPNLAGTNQQGYRWEKKQRKTKACANLFLFIIPSCETKKEGAYLNCLQQIDFTFCVYKTHQSTQLVTAYQNLCTITPMSLSLKSASVSDTKDIFVCASTHSQRPPSIHGYSVRSEYFNILTAAIVFPKTWFDSSSLCGKLVSSTQSCQIKHRLPITSLLQVFLVPCTEPFFFGLKNPI